jgi:hypothetical protein
MPVTFQNESFGGNLVTTQTGQAISGTDGDTGITFNLTSQAVGGSVSMQLANVINFIFVNDGGADDVVRFDLNGGTFNGTIGNPISLEFGSYNSAGWEIRFVNDTPGTTQADVVQSTGSGDITGVTGTFTSILFTSNNGGSSTSFDIDVFRVNSATCYLGTVEMQTPEGNKAVSDLRPGDELVTAAGGTTRVLWVGRQSLSPWYNDSAAINPICVSANAIAQGVPSRDLHVSPDHAIAIDGILYNAMTLVNESNIYQMDFDRTDLVRYYHIETEQHELLIAEGCPAESYLDYNNLFEFENADERVCNRIVPEMGLPRVSSRRLVSKRLREQILANSQPRQFADAAC